METADVDFFLVPDSLERQATEEGMRPLSPNGTPSVKKCRLLTDTHEGKACLVCM